MVLVLLFNLFPFTALAAPVTVGGIVVDVKADGITDIPQGGKGIAYNLTSIEMSVDSTLDLSSTTMLGGVRVLANGSLDETGKFNIYFDYTAKKLTLTLKNAGYQLMKHALYSIYIPQGTFKNAAGTVINSAFYYYFTTSTDANPAEYQNDILASASVYDGQRNISSKTNQIVLNFVDEIVLNPAAQSSIGSYVQISSTALDVSIPGYGGTPFTTPDDSTGNFNVYVQGSQLILQPKLGVLRDFAKYTVTLQPNTVYLRDSSTAIYNDAHTLDFYTDNMVESMTPQNGQTGVDLKPTVTVQFKYPVQIVDSTKITGGNGITITNIQLSNENKSLLVSLRGVTAAELLRKSTLYDLTVNGGAVRFTDYPSISNSGFSLAFTTTGDAQSPVATGYSSSQSFNDDITTLESTQLDSSGSIYVRFDRTIKANTQAMSLAAATKLYKIPKAADTAYDPSGKLYDRTLSYKSVYTSVYSVVPYYINDPAHMEDVSYLSPLPYCMVEVIQPNLLKITPPYAIDSLNKYRVVIDKSVIEDSSGINVEKDIDFVFWTRASGTYGVPAWEGISSTTAPVYGQPQYGPSLPLEFTIDREVIVKAQDQVLQERPVLMKRISFDALKSITLLDVYNTDTTSNQVAFSKYELYYDYSSGTKKTKLRLYPGTVLQSGKYYRLNIPAGVLQTRSKQDLAALQRDFVVKGGLDSSRGIYTLENGVIQGTDLASTGEATFSILGFNFIEQVQSIQLTGLTSGVTLTVPQSNIFYDNSTKIRVRISEDTAKALSLAANAGDYQVAVRFSGDSENCTSPVNLTIVAKGKIQVKDKYPVSSAWVDETSLLPKTIDGITRYFLRVTFHDPDDSLDSTISLEGLSILRDSCTVVAQGSGASMIDRDFLTLLINNTTNRDTYIQQYLLTKDASKREAYLFIPVKLLRPQTTYNVTIVPEVIHYAGGTGGVDNSYDTINWSFTTMAVPYVKGVSVSSVVEDYDEDTPIILTGDFFNSGTVSVYFNDEPAEKVVIKTDAQNKTYLEVYLPSGSDKLEPGIYNIIVQNDSGHQRIEYGSFSVVKSGSNIPDEEKRVKDESSKGTVFSDIKVSQDTLELKSKYNNSGYLEFKLDEMMGEDVLVRKVVIDGDIGHYISMLDTKSKWANISIYRLGVSYSGRENIELNLGRLEPAKVQALKAKLKGKAVKSEFIQVTGSNFSMDKVVISLPYKNSSGSSIKALRYDEDRREWTDQRFILNQVNGTVTLESVKSGIFVLVE